MIALIFLLSSLAHASPEQDAYDAIRKALYKQTGAEQTINVLEKKYEKKYLNEDLKFFGGYTLMIVKVWNDKQIQFKWSFQ